MKRVFLAAAAFLAGCGSFGPSGPADPKLMAFIPADTIVLGGIRFAELKQTPLYREVEPMLGGIAREGFDPRRDVEEVLIASNGKDAVVMARGKFDGKELQRLPRFEHRGVALYGNREGAVAWIDAATVVAGTTPAVRAAIDQEKSGRKAGAGLLAKGRALPSPNQIWMVSTGSPTFLALPDAPNSEMLEKMLHAMSDLQFYADLRQGIFAALTGNCANEADAKFLGDTVRGLMGLGRLSIPRGEPKLAQVFDGIAVAQTDRMLSITAKVPAEVASQAMERLRSFSRQPSRRGSRPHLH